MRRSSGYNRFGVLMGTSWRASGPRWPRLRADSLPMITLFPSQGDFCATAAKDLVMAQITARHLSPDEMHQALQQTYASLQALKAQEEAKGSVAVVTPEMPPERVNWRKSITKHVVTCLECRASFKQL